MNMTHQSMSASEQGVQRPANRWSDETDEAKRLARLEQTVLMIMGGDSEAASRWLHTRLAILDNETPLEHAVTDTGACHIRNLISRRVHKVFS